MRDKVTSPDNSGRAAQSTVSPPMLRAAKLSSWVFLALYLVGIFRGAGPETLLLLLPMALAIGAFYSPAHRGFVWCAFLANVAWALLGLYETGPALFDVLGLTASPAEGAGLALLVLPLLVVMPCTLNACALYLHSLTTRPEKRRANTSLERTREG